MQGQVIAESVRSCDTAAHVSAKETVWGKGARPSFLAHWLQAFKVSNTCVPQ